MFTHKRKNKSKSLCISTQKLNSETEENSPVKCSMMPERHSKVTHEAQPSLVFSLLVCSDTVAKWTTLALVSGTLFFGRDFIYKADVVARKERKRENAEKLKQTN